MEAVKLCECGCGNLAPIAKRSLRKRGYVIREPMRFIQYHHLGFGEKAARWKGGWNIGRGYTGVMNDGKQALLHRVIAKKVLGKPLPLKATVHHHNQEQLVICENQAYHMLLERRTRALRACGHANFRKCHFCKRYDDPNNISVNNRGDAFHRLCVNEYEKERQRIIRHSATIKGEGRA